MNSSSGSRTKTNEQTVKDESNQEKLQNVNDDDDDDDEKSSFSFVNDLIASSNEKIVNSSTISTINENTKRAESESNLKLSDLLSTKTSVINSNNADNSSNNNNNNSNELCLDEISNNQKINETTPSSASRPILKSIKQQTLGSESTTPYSSSHSTSSTGITVLENNYNNNITGAQFKNNDLDQELSLLDEFDFCCVDEENDGDDEFDESLNVDDGQESLDEEFEKTGRVPVKFDEYDNLSEKTLLSSSTDAFKFEKLQGKSILKDFILFFYSILKKKKKKRKDLLERYLRQSEFLIFLF